MKIGIFTPYLDTMGGGEKYMLTAAVCLAKDHRVFLFWDPKEELKIKKSAKDRFGLDLSKIIFIPSIFSSEVGFVQRFFESRKFDAIIYKSDGSIPSVWSKLFIHFQFPVEWVDNSVRNKVKIMQVQKIFCNSFFTKSYVDRKFGVNSLVLYPPVDIGAHNKQKKENIILHVGRFGVNIEGSNYKKQDVMIETFKKMVASGIKNWKLVCIISVRPSDEDKFEDLKKKAQEEPVEFYKNVNKDKVLDFYRKAKIYWHASGFGEDLKKHPEKAEHFGIATVEAMSYGVVPVVINAGGQKEIVENEKSGFLWNNISDFIQKTIQLTEDNMLWKNMSEEAVIRSKIFSTERFCKELSAIVK